MAIIDRFFNTTVNIYRIVQVENDLGEFGEEQYVLKQTNIKARIGSGASNEATREGALKDLGFGSGLKNKLFIETTVDIKSGDRVIEAVDTNNKYYVDYVNKRPGGLTDHHQECLMTQSDFQVAS